MGQTAIVQRGFDFGVDTDTGASEVAVFDAVIREAHHCEIAITENPVETGVSMADHAYAKPDSLEMEIAVSDTPLISDGNKTPSYQLATTWTGSGTGNVRRSVNCWEYLVGKAKAFVVFDVVTGLRSYKDMMIVSMDAEQDKETASILKAKISLKQVIFATTSSVLYSPRGPKKTKRQAAPKTDKGKQESPEPDKKKQVQSTLSLLLGRGA